jgi:hypothetical protein
MVAEPRNPATKQQEISVSRDNVLFQKYIPMGGASTRRPMRGSPNQSLSHIKPVSGTPKRKLENGEQRLAPENLRYTTENLEIAGQRLARTSLRRGNVGGFHTPGNHTAETGLAGWGARIRTWEWRNQNPLPYHLATPHRPPREHVPFLPNPAGTCAKSSARDDSGGAPDDQRPRLPRLMPDAITRAAIGV